MLGCTFGFEIYCGKGGLPHNSIIWSSSFVAFLLLDQFSNWEFPKVKAKRDVSDLKEDKNGFYFQAFLISVSKLTTVNKKFVLLLHCF